MSRARFEDRVVVRRRRHAGDDGKTCLRGKIAWTRARRRNKRQDDVRRMRGATTVGTICRHARGSRRTRLGGKGSFPRERFVFYESTPRLGPRQRRPRGFWSCPSRPRRLYFPLLFIFFFNELPFVDKLNTVPAARRHTSVLTAAKPSRSRRVIITIRLTKARDILFHINITFVCRCAGFYAKEMPREFDARVKLHRAQYGAPESGIMRSVWSREEIVGNMIGKRVWIFNRKGFLGDR